MKALILAAGLGSRLESLTADNPKALLEVNGSPILAYQLDGLLAVAQRLAREWDAAHPRDP